MTALNQVLSFDRSVRNQRDTAAARRKHDAALRQVAVACLLPPDYGLLPDAVLEGLLRVLGHSQSSLHIDLAAASLYFTLTGSSPQQTRVLQVVALCSCQGVLSCGCALIS